MRSFKRLFSSLPRNKLRVNPIEDDPAAQELKIRLNDSFASVGYNKIDKSTYELVHSAIPEAYQGQGLGAILAERIFNHLAKKNIKMKVTCEYLQNFADKNRDKYKNNLI